MSITTRGEIVLDMAKMLVARLADLKGLRLDEQTMAYARVNIDAALHSYHLNTNHKLSDDLKFRLVEEGHGELRLVLYKNDREALIRKHEDGSMTVEYLPIYTVDDYYVRDIITPLLDPPNCT